MRGRLFRKELGLLLGSPVLYLGALLMAGIVFFTISPYWNLYQNARQPGESVPYYSTDGDVTEGYLPNTKKDIYEKALAELEAYLVEERGMTREEAAQAVGKTKTWEKEKIIDYFKTEYGVRGMRASFDSYSYRRADRKELERVLKLHLGEKGTDTYTNQFAYKYSDFLGISSILFTILVFVLALIRDMKKDIYGLIHTKPVEGSVYLGAKMSAGIGAVFLFVIPLTLAVDGITMKIGREYGFSVDFLDIWKKFFLFNVPGILLTGSLMMSISILFRSSVPAIPAMLCYYLYCNIGSVDSAVGYHYRAKPLALFVRFPGNFTMLKTPEGAAVNQLFLLLLAGAVFVFGLRMWERRRGG